MCNFRVISKLNKERFILLNIDKIELIKEQYQNINCSKLIIFKGEYGIGKTTVIDIFFSELHPLNKIIIKPCSDNNLTMQPIINALLEYSINTQNREIASNLNYMVSEENLKHIIYSICKKNEKAVIFINDFDKLSDEIQKFSIDFIKNIIKINSKFLTLILVECNTDELSQNIRENLNRLYDYCETTNIINFDKIKLNELELFIDEVLGSKLICSTKRKTQIIDASFYNPLYLKNIIYYLKDIAVLNYKDNFWECGTIDDYLLSDIFKEYILRRYENLEESFKTVLKKASIVGFEIDRDLLKSQFRINQADAALIRIEKLSNLIKNKINKFVFENYEVYYSIKSLIPEDEKISWNKMLADYFKEYLKDNLKIFMKNDNWQEYLKCLYKIAFHSEECGKFDVAFQYYIRCIPLLNTFSDYNNCKTIIKKALSLYCYTNLSREYEYYLKSNLAELYKSVGQFPKSLELYTEIQTKFEIGNYFKSKFLYDRAYCLYNTGRADEALNILIDLKTKLKDSTEFTELFVKILSLLAAIYDHHGNKRDSIRHYEWCLKKCQSNKKLEKEYYRLLGRSNMFYSNEISLMMLEESVRYFMNSGNQKEYAKILHNLGSENINAYNLEAAEKNLQESMEIFNSYCSNDVHYPINNLAIVKALSGDIKESLILFSKAYSKDYEFFSQIWVKLNISTCKRMLDDFNSCIEILNECDEQLKTTSENTSLLNSHLKTCYALYYKEKKQFKLALDYFLQALKIYEDDLNDMFYVNFYLKNINEISSILNIELDKKITQRKITLTNYVNHLYKNNVFFGDFMFWGS